ncbi:hypothetical protein IscW_ISCW007111 [Ixodes scapularis]|uniref:Uncharacterized protein n=1 Tax=Ixodes scapularis TaxID=6945 RepID=B7PWW8_IXOSC|nr:hypothetical protein IscW_ISCW007111 [Ixodes scapularis]|eukprot:XP_002410363.1 hypothetical protein IscW_ISCW007111 [Ixodes scapularis]
MATVSPQTNEEKLQLSALTEMVNTTRLILSYPEGIESQAALDNKLSSFPENSRVFFDNYLNAVVANRKMRRQINRLLLDSGRGQRVITYDAVQRRLALPAEFLLPPLYAADSFLAANYGTLGTEVSIALWRGVTTATMKDHGGLYVGALLEHHAKRFGCNLESHDDIIVAVAGEVVAEGFATCVREMSTVPSVADLKLLFLASCLPSCGSRDLRCNRATSCSVQFRQVFQCPA